MLSNKKAEFGNISCGSINSDGSISSNSSISASSMSCTNNLSCGGISLHSGQPLKSYIGLSNVVNERQYSANNPPPQYFVTRTRWMFNHTGSTTASAVNVHISHRNTCGFLAVSGSSAAAGQRYFIRLSSLLGALSSGQSIGGGGYCLKVTVTAANYLGYDYEGDVGVLRTTFTMKLSWVNTTATLIPFSFFEVYYDADNSLEGVSYHS